MFEEVKNYVSKGFYNKLLALPKDKKYLLCDKQFKSAIYYSFMSIQELVECAIIDLKVEDKDIQKDWLVSDNEYEIICNIEDEIYHNEVEIYEVQLHQKVSHNISVWATLDGETFVIVKHNYPMEVIKLNHMLDVQEYFENEVMNSDFFTQKEKKLIIAKMREY